MNNLLICLTISPIFFALLIILCASNFWAKIIVNSAAICNIVIISNLWKLVEQKKITEYLVGGVEKNLGIALQINEFVLILILLINIIVCALFIYLSSIKDQEVKYQEFALILILWAGLNGILMAGDLFNIFVFLEISSLASYALVINNQNKQSAYSALSYLIFGSIAASFYLIGVIFIYYSTGSLNIEIVQQTLLENLRSTRPSLMVVLGLVFIIIGTIFKIGILGLHRYLVDIYQKAPMHITAFFSAAVSKVNIYLLYFLGIGVFACIWQVGNFPLKSYLHYLALAGGIFFALQAIFTQSGDLKKLLIWSSFSQLNYILLALSLNGFIFGNISNIAYSGFVKLIVNHTLVKFALFIMLEVQISQRLLVYYLQDQQKSAYFNVHAYKDWQKKILNLFFIWFWLYLIGFPPSLGFMGKFDLVVGLLQEEKYLSVFVFSLTIIASVIYAVKFLKTMLDQDQEIISEDSNCGTLGCQSGLIGFIWIISVLLVLVSGLIFFGLVLK